MELPVAVTTPQYTDNSPATPVFMALQEALPDDLKRTPRSTTVAGYVVVKLQPSGIVLENVALTVFAKHPITGEPGTVREHHISCISERFAQACPSIRVAAPDTPRQCYSGQRPPSDIPEEKLGPFARTFGLRVTGLLNGVEQLDNKLLQPPAAQSGAPDGVQ